MLHKTQTKMKSCSYLLLLFTFCFSCEVSASKGFNYMVSLPEAKSKGFHKINIAPAILAKTAYDFSDIRLFDEQKKEIPYILRKDFVRRQYKNFVPYQLLSKSTPGDTATEIIVKNQFNTKINNLSVFLNNAEVSKQIIISGSYDQKQWYAVKQNYNISGISNQNKVTELNTIYFPLSDYVFYKIIINDKNSLPVKVLQAGYYKDSVYYGEEKVLPAPQFTRTENQKEHITQLQLNFNEAYVIDKINLAISAPTLYRRAVRVYAVHQKDGNSKKVFLQEGTLFAGSENQIILDQVREQHLLLEISNDNNPLLEIENIECLQLSQYLIAYLESKGHYTLKFGNEDMATPVYDLAYFEHIIPAQIPTIETGNLAFIHSPDEPVNRAIEPAYYNKKFFLWAVIIAVTLVLLLVSGKMLNEMNKK